MPTLRQALADGTKVLERAQTPDARLDAAWLLEAVVQKPRLTLALDESMLPEPQAERYASLLARRAGGEPLQYILGAQDFFGLRFRVDSRVLIPRPETELLCEKALEYLRARPRAKVLDLCTGSGALAVTLALRCPKAEVWACDVSPDALEVARENARRLGARVRFAKGDLFAPLSGECFDWIVSNPPYIARAELDGLQREVRREPVLALDGGADGLDFYRRIAREAPRHLRAGGGILLEVGAGQARAVASMLGDAGLEPDAILPDLSGIPRVVCAARR